MQTAYERAKRAQSRGVHTIEVVCDAMHRTQPSFVEPFPHCRGIVVKRIQDEDGIIVQLVVRVDVTDILVTAWDEYVRSLTFEQPKFRRRQSLRGVTSR